MTGETGRKEREKALHDGVGLWAEEAALADLSGRPALFLDRDGVLVEEVDFLCRREDVRMSEGIAEIVAEANRRAVAVIVVTNQSGIARGLFGWAEFAAVQAFIGERLAEAGARIDATFACGYHRDGAGALCVEGHFWRKPRPGMLIEARDRLGVDLSRSFIVGDRVSDLEAGCAAGLAGGALVLTGYGAGQVGRFEAARPSWEAAGYRASVAEEPAQAAHLFLTGVTA